MQSDGDVDLVVRHTDREACHVILTDMGFTSLTKQDDREWQYIKGGIEFELHDRLIYHEDVTLPAHERFFNDCWHYVRNGELDDSYHFLFLLSHLRKHFLNAGVGFRQFADLAVMIRNCDWLDWKWIDEKLNELDLRRFAGVCFAFMESWFGVSAPLSYAAVDDDFYEMATRKVFADGVFGFQNEENQDSAALNHARKVGNRKLAVVTSVTRRAFPSFASISAEKGYEYLKRYPYLLPTAWLHRLLRKLRMGKAGNAARLIRNTYVSKEIYDKRTDMLARWGLD